MVSLDAFEAYPSVVYNQRDGELEQADICTSRQTYLK
jgi:hypothetical protein